MNEYEAIFAKRGSSYHGAMQRYPHARDAEFTALFSAIDSNTIKRLADIPAGGGYLRGFLPPDCHIDCFEPCSTFDNTNQIDLEKLILPGNYYDAVVNLAAIHHIKHKQAFVSSLFNAVKPRGYLLIGDVLAGSPVAHFLDDFCSQYNGTGHRGEYLTLDSLAGIGLAANHRVMDHQLKACPWIFDNEQALIDFCRLLFGLGEISDALLFSALRDRIGVAYPQNKVQLSWELLYMTIQKM